MPYRNLSEDLIGTSELAEVFQKSVSTIRFMWRNGDIPKPMQVTPQFNAWDRDELARFLREHHTRFNGYKYVAARIEQLGREEQDV